VKPATHRYVHLNPDALGEVKEDRAMMISMNTYDGPYPLGVPNPYGGRVHAYPTRYHGPIYTRPMYRLKWKSNPYDFGVEPLTGLGQESAAGAPDPRTPADCDALYPNPAEVTDADGFAAHVQNMACQERVRQMRDSRRWLIGLSAAFVAGFFIGRKG
jgi:hypothetical protein